MNNAQSILLQLSTGAISLIDATAKLGLPDVGHTLQRLREANLTMPRLPKHVVKAQSEASLTALRLSLTDNNK